MASAPAKKKQKRRPSLRAQKALAKLEENGGNVSRAMIEAGFSPSYAKNPKKLLETEAGKRWMKMLDAALPDGLVLLRHNRLLNAQRLDHMTFPLGPADEDEADFDDEDDVPPGMQQKAERTTLTDQEIVTMLAEVNCVVRRIVHGEQARHVYFWAPDSRAQKDAVELAYKLRGRLRFLGDGGGPQFNGPTQINFNADRTKFAA